MRNLLILFKMDIKRSINTTKIVFLSVIFVLTIGMAVAAIFGLRSTNEALPIKIPNFVNVLYYFYYIVVPLVTLMFGTGIISLDKSSHWLRTIVSRPVSLQEYITAKLLAIGTIICVLMIILGIIPAAVVAIFSGIDIAFNFGDFLLLHITFWLQSFTYIALMAWMSMWLPSYFNLLVFGAWFFADFMLNSAVIPLITQIGELYKWKITWLIIAADFIFPSGFSDGLKKIISDEAGFPTENILWGFASLCAFLALSYWQINKISLIKND